MLIKTIIVRIRTIIVRESLICTMGQSFPKAKAFYVKSRSGPIGIKSHSRPIGIKLRSEPIEIQGDIVYNMASGNATSFAISVKR